MISDRKALGLSLAATFAVAGAGAAATASSVKTWYQKLDQPSWRPPDGAFAPVWNVLYAQMAVSAWLAWKADGRRTTPVVPVYGTQLLLNGAWTFVFFGLRRPAWALGEMAVLWGAIVVTVATFARRSRTAALLLLPYLAWTTFAAFLNLAIHRRNPRAHEA